MAARDAPHRVEPGRAKGPSFRPFRAILAIVARTLLEGPLASHEGCLDSCDFTCVCPLPGARALGLVPYFFLGLSFLPGWPAGAYDAQRVVEFCGVASWKRQGGGLDSLTGESATGVPTGRRGRRRSHLGRNEQEVGRRVGVTARTRW